jgi:hypothetical protein
MSLYEEDVIRCQCCSLAHGAFDITFFRSFPLCDSCFNDDGVLRTCMELHVAERNFLLAEQQGSSVAGEKLIAELKEFCFRGARQRALYQETLLENKN